MPLKPFTVNLFRIYLLRFVLLVVAVQILNLSVYGQDVIKPAQSNTLGELNQIDSMIEYVAEIILDYKNAFPENGTHNHQSHTSHQLKHGSFNMISFRKGSDVKRFCRTSNIHIPSKEEYKNLFTREIIPPPPKA